MKTRLVASLMVVALLGLGACGIPPFSPKWTRFTPVPMADTLNRDSRVQVWTHGDTVNYWHSVVVSHDSVTGIRYQHRHDDATGPAPLIHGDATRYSLPLTQVDSMRIGRYNRANTYFWIGDLTFIVLGTIFSPCHDPLGCT